MISIFHGLISLVLVGCGLFCVYEARPYTDEQRARAPRLIQAYFGCGVVLAIVGIGGLVWIARGGSVWPISGLVSLVAVLPCLIQYRLHQFLAVDRSPLADRLGRRIARTVNYPER